MKAIVLAAGRGSRFGRITQALPKPLIQVAGKALITHVFDALPDQIDECVVVVGYLGDMIRAHLGERYGRLKLCYVEQSLPGTGGALLACAPLMQSQQRFMVIGADDIFEKRELTRLLWPYASYGIFHGMSNKDAKTKVVFCHDCVLLGMAAAEHADDMRYFGVGAYVLPSLIFDESFEVLPNGELSIPHTLACVSFSVEVVVFEHWLPVNNVQELRRAEKALAARRIQVA